MDGILVDILGHARFQCYPRHLVKNLTHVDKYCSKRQSTSKKNWVNVKRVVPQEHRDLKIGKCDIRYTQRRSFDVSSSFILF